jgi:hypothetical protein
VSFGLHATSFELEGKDPEQQPENRGGSVGLHSQKRRVGSAEQPQNTLERRFVKKLSRMRAGGPSYREAKGGAFSRDRNPLI